MVSVRKEGVGSTNVILCGGCKRWVHKKCSGLKGPLRPDIEFRCARCLGTARAIDERQFLDVEIGNEKLEFVPEFCYLWDMLSAGYTTLNILYRGDHLLYIRAKVTSFVNSHD